jgi:hypothetical protein
MAAYWIELIHCSLPYPFLLQVNCCLACEHIR